MLSMCVQSTPKPTDTRCLQTHLEKARKILGKLPRVVIADAGYGSEGNYAYLKNEHVKTSPAFPLTGSS